MRSPIAPRRWAYCLLLSLLTVTGCGQAPPSPDQEWARGAVQTALAAWQKGARPETLQKQTPPLQFLDEDWQKFVALQAFTVSDPAVGKDGVLRCPVKLSLQDRQGKKIEKEIVYVADRARGVIGRDP
jgi:hypothetical protein